MCIFRKIRRLYREAKLSHFDFKLPPELLALENHLLIEMNQNDGYS